MAAQVCFVDELFTRLNQVDSSTLLICQPLTGPNVVILNHETSLYILTNRNAKGCVVCTSHRSIVG